MFINKFLKAIAALVAVLVIASCNKEPDLIGLDLLPEGDRLNMSFIDTSSIIAYTVKEDSLRTENLSGNLLGYMNDPIFGPVKASFYTQYRLPNSNFSFGDNPVADSIVFTLVYNGVYGDSLTQHTAKVYEVDEILDLEKKYYSTTILPVLPTPIGEATFTPNFKKADSVNKLPVKPHLRITLTQEFANKLLSASDSTLLSNTFFTKIFKGLFVDVAPVAPGSPGSVLNFDMLNEMSRVTLYYHNDKDTATSIKFLINSSSPRFNNYNHYGYASAAPELLQQFAGDTATSHQRVFLQSMAGSKVKLRIPYLENIPKNANIAINEALLIFTNNEPEGIFKAPGQLSLRALSDTGSYLIIPDEKIGGAYFGGRYINKKEYQFRITKYVQDRMRYPNLPDTDLMLLIPGGALTANRLILNGPGHPTDRMKLVLYYTIIE